MRHKYFKERGLFNTRLKDIGRKIWDIAFKLSEFSCSCGWECGKCGRRGNHANPHTIEPGDEKEDHESKELVKRT